MKKEEAKKKIKTESQDCVNLSDEILSVVNAAGEINYGKTELDSGDKAAGVGGGRKQW